MSRNLNWSFVCQDYRTTLEDIAEEDFIYCDPPYVGRHVDYFDSWDEKNEQHLFKILSESPSRFILSTWHSNQYRENAFLQILWSNFQVLTKEHFYFVGGKVENRNPMLEALVTNFTPKHIDEDPKQRVEQLSLLEKLGKYKELEVE